MSWLVVARKDLLAEARGKDTIVPVVLTSLLVATVGLLAFHDVHDEASVGAGVLWTSLAFASAIGLARAFGAENDRGTLDTLLALPISRASLLAGKIASGFALLAVAALVVTPVYLVAGDAAIPAAWPALLLVLALGGLGLATTGAMLSALSTQARSRDLLLPVLLFPLIAPLLIAAVHGTADILAGLPFAQWRPELLLLAGYDLAFLAVSMLLIEQAVGA